MADRLFVQVDVAFGRNRKVRQAGMLGWVVFLQLVATHRVNPAEGWISASEAAPDAILLCLAAFAAELDEAQIATALGALEQAEMIQRDEAGNVFLPGWQDWFGPLTGTERSRRHRARMQARNAEQRAATDGNEVQRAATLGNRCNAALSSPLVSSSSDPAPAEKPASQPGTAAPSKDESPVPSFVRPEDRALAAEVLRNGR